MIKSNIIKKIDLYFFLAAVLAFKIPNFYLLFFFKNAFLTSQAIARIIIICIFIYIMIKKFTYKESIIKNTNVTITIFISLIVFFLIQSFSVFSAINISAFISRYKDVLLSFVGIFCFYYYKNEYKLIIYAILIGTSISLIYQGFIFFFQTFFVQVISHFIYDKHVLLVLANIDRHRIYTDTYDEIAIPFLMTTSFLKFPYRINVIGILTISFFSAVSNFRTRILMLVFSFIGSIITIKKISFIYITLFSFSILLIASIANTIVSERYGFSFINRIQFEDQNTDIKSIYSRVDQIKLGLEMGTYSIFGVGLGNYYDHLPSYAKHYNSGYSWVDIQDSGAKVYIHNNLASIIAETGYISFAVFIWLLLLFSITDIKHIIHGTDYQKAIVIAFWTLFIHGLLNPTVPLSYQFFFWGLRGLLID